MNRHSAPAATHDPVLGALSQNINNGLFKCTHQKLLGDGSEVGLCWTRSLVITCARIYLCYSGGQQHCPTAQ